MTFIDWNDLGAKICQCFNGTNTTNSLAMTNEGFGASSAPGLFSQPVARISHFAGEDHSVSGIYEYVVGHHENGSNVGQFSFDAHVKIIVNESSGDIDYLTLPLRSVVDGVALFSDGKFSASWNYLLHIWEFVKGDDKVTSSGNFFTSRQYRDSTGRLYKIESVYNDIPYKDQGSLYTWWNSSSDTYLRVWYSPMLDQWCALVGGRSIVYGGGDETFVIGGHCSLIEVSLHGDQINSTFILGSSSMVEVVLGAG